MASKTELYVGETPIIDEATPVEGDYVEMLGERYYRISHYDRMRPFFMSLVSSADHWLFIASTGGLTAGRINADSALFPYETEDKITAHSEQTGSKTIIRATRDGQTYLWEPFSERYAGAYRCDRNLYKNVYGNKLIFEEVNHDLKLTMRTGWFTGDRFGFIRHCWLSNDGETDCQVELLDGLQNLLPYGATNEVQTSLSSLMNAYKRNELEPESGLGIYALSATLSDRAEPSESLKATVAWQVGLNHVDHLLGSDQLGAFRSGWALTPELDIVGKPGAYFVHSTFVLPSGQTKEWRIVADVNLDRVAITELIKLLSYETDVINEQLDEDIERGTTSLVRYVAAADGLQLTGEYTTSAHHFANVLFNIMRGGIFANGYQIDRDDLIDFVQTRNHSLLTAYPEWFADLPKQLSIQELYTRAQDSHVPDLVRICYEYLPLSFSRRHGDPSRPWNAFSINLKRPDGSPRLDYQGNWRDIFQNWEPLAYSFPAYVEGMIAKFLNATTADGYNPYRVTRDGIEWEIPVPNNPWANIGYWSDHQIIYLQKLLEIAEQVQPGALEALWNRAVFSYANVPYRLRTYSEMLKDWNETIDFDWESEQAIEAAVDRMGTDARLIRDATGAVVHVTMTEKLMVLLLAKLTNLVPEGGIWMNTQRPEWNDANNALVGKGLSVVTAAYLLRFITFWKAQLETGDAGSFAVNETVMTLFDEVLATLHSFSDHLLTGFNDQTRLAFMEKLGTAATAYRAAIYADGPSTNVSALSAGTLLELLSLAQAFIEHTLRANLRPDGLIHSYNILELDDDEAAVEHLYLMLEGQVAVLSSGLLTPAESARLLQSLRQSDLYRDDLHTYMLYPNRALPGFLQKNNVPGEMVADSALVAALMQNGDGRLLTRDADGIFHFNGGFHNANDVVRVLNDLARDPGYAQLVEAEREFMLDLFEATFHHSAFTGRSGTFYAYEGLGSVYWHMVSKLLLAVQESYQRAEREQVDPATLDALRQAYEEIRGGLGFNKTPSEYGAFPTDPYSHTPIAGGARQPGMTGQVKEEILTRMGELGISIRHGALCFSPSLLHADEFLQEDADFPYLDTTGSWRTLSLSPGSLAFCIGQTPVVYVLGESARIAVRYADGSEMTVEGDCLDADLARHIFDRDGQVKMLTVTIEQ